MKRTMAGKALRGGQLGKQGCGNHTEQENGSVVRGIGDVRDLVSNAGDNVTGNHRDDSDRSTGKEEFGKVPGKQKCRDRYGAQYSHRAREQAGARVEEYLFAVHDSHPMISLEAAATVVIGDRVTWLELDRVVVVGDGPVGTAALVVVGSGRDCSTRGGQVSPGSSCASMIRVQPLMLRPCRGATLASPSRREKCWNRHDSSVVWRSGTAPCSPVLGGIVEFCSRRCSRADAADAYSLRTNLTIYRQSSRTSAVRFASSSWKRTSWASLLPSGGVGVRLRLRSPCSGRGRRRQGRAYCRR